MGGCFAFPWLFFLLWFLLFFTQNKGVGGGLCAGPLGPSPCSPTGLYYPGPDFDVKKVLHKLLPNKKKHACTTCSLIFLVSDKSQGHLQGLKLFLK